MEIDGETFGYILQGGYMVSIIAAVLMVILFGTRE